MKLFTVGPVEMYPETLKIAATQLPYFRTEAFSQIMMENERQLKQLLGLRDGLIATITGSGSSAMEAVIACSFRRGDRVLIINGGEFGERFCKLCKIYHVPFDEITLAYDEKLTEEHLNIVAAKQYCALLVNLHETSTGQLYDIEMLSAFTKKHHMYLIVDAISSFLADPYDMDAYGVDCTILSSQKALALSPGIAMVAMQSSFYAEMIEPKEDTLMYLSLKKHMKNMERGQTPNTPAVGIILELQQRLKMIATQGYTQVQKEIQDRALYFRDKIAVLHIKTLDIPLSNALTPILLDDADVIYHYLKDTHDIYVTPSGGEYRKRLLRVGHLGNLNLSDYDELCSLLKECIK